MPHPLNCELLFMLWRTLLVDAATLRLVSHIILADIDATLSAGSTMDNGLLARVISSKPLPMVCCLQCCPWIFRSLSATFRSFVIVYTINGRCELAS